MTVLLEISLVSLFSTSHDWSSVGTISSSNRPAFWRGGGALLAHQRVLVLLLAADAVALGDDVGRLDHRHVERALVLHDPVVAIELVFMFICTRLMNSRPPATDTGAPCSLMP